MLKVICIVCILIPLSGYSSVKPYYDIVVAADGSGDYKTLTGAINSLPMFTYERTVIFIKNGIYNEKIRIEQNNITLLGESRDSTIICYSQLRTDWQNNKDYIGPAVINIHADDVILKNLTVENTQPQIGPHAFAVYGTGTRTLLLNCNVLSKGGDTVSLWNYKNGKYYHSNCNFEGSVDFMCPRGVCYISNSRFYELKKTSALWHAGISDKNQKLVICDSYFDGVEGFQLGRHHYDAQFFLLNCSFSENMADKPIFRVKYEKDKSRNRPNIYGNRYYFYNCHRKGGNYKWLADNLPEAENSPNHDDITAEWTFNGDWDPELKEGPVVRSVKIEDKGLILYFNELLTVREELTLKTNTGKILRYESGRGRDVLKFYSEEYLTEKDFVEPLVIINGVIIATEASVYERKTDKEINLESIVIKNH